MISLSTTTILNAQEIDFGDFSSKYTVSITELIPAEDLSFGMVIQNEGLKTVDLLDAKVLMIEGVKYLDVVVTITADNYLYLNNDVSCNGSNSNCIPFTLQAAYANRGNNNTNQAVLMQVASNVASAQFPILARGNRPPGPPPTPVYEGYNPALFNETAYLYLYGSINVGNQNAGSYSGQIQVTVTYD
ncbi:hypothetical protein [Gracilimonas amylolytica]|uniref:hypothetical protein n=1 Tax=Gracilimonas amylolytica TaxID=1749045 RepID=UPI001E31207C|nr:hypothetical protein [Gracilimonas amylolytica]